MTDVNPNPPTPAPAGAPAAAASDERQLPLIVYVLFLLGFLTAWITPIVGVVIAYMNRDTAPEWLKSHYTFQVRTFWIGLVCGLAAFSADVRPDRLSTASAGGGLVHRPLRRGTQPPAQQRALSDAPELGRVGAGRPRAMFSPRGGYSAAAAKVRAPCR